MLRKTVSIIAIAAGLGLAPVAVVQAQTSSTPTPPATTDQPAQQNQNQSTTPGAMTPGTGAGSTAQTPGMGTGTDSGTAAQTPTTPGSTDQTATTQGEEGRPIDGQITMQQEGTYLGTDLIGTSVFSPNDDDIGDVNDVIITTDGQLQGIVVGVGGFLGIGQKDVAIQMDKVQMMDQGDNTAKLVVSATREELEQAPEFRTVAEMNSERNNNAAGTGNAPMTGTTDGATTGTGMGTGAGSRTTPGTGTSE